MRLDIYLHEERPHGHVNWTIDKPTNKRKQRYSVELTCTVAQKIHVHFSPSTDSGRPATFDGNPTCTVTDGNGTFTMDDNGMGLYVVSPDEPGVTSYVVEADGDLGSGVETLQLAITLTSQGEHAKNFGATADAPENK